MLLANATKQQQKRELGSNARSSCVLLLKVLLRMCNVYWEDNSNGTKKFIKSAIKAMI